MAEMRLAGLLAAAQCLTIVPLGAPRPRAGQLPWHGAVGLAIGAALCLCAWLMPAGVASALVLTLAWGLISGFLHLDGLADCADGMMSGRRQGDCLQIMRDPSCGSGGVVAIIMVLLGKTLLLWTLGLSWALLLVPMLARSTAALLFCCTPYVGGGSGSGIMRPGDGDLVALGAMFGWLLAWALLGTLALWWGLAALMLFAIWRGLWMRRIGGFSGDCVGALIELLELALLCIAAL